MTFLLFQKVAVRLAHLLHARLSPLAFLLNLSLLSLLARILLSLASSPHLHTILISTSTALQGSVKLNLADAAVFKAFFLRIELGLIFLLANFIILALFFSSKGGRSTSASSSQALSFHESNYMNHLEGTGSEDADKPFDSLAEYLLCHEPPNIPSSPNNLKLAIPSAPPIELDKSSGTCTSSDEHRLLAVGDTTAPSADRRLACSNSLHINETYSNQLEIVPISQEINHSQKFRRTRPKSPSNQVELVHTYSHGNSDKQGIASCSLDAHDMKLCEYAHVKPSSNTSLATPSSSSMLTNQVELVPTIADVTIPHADSSQKSLIRHKSHIQTSNHAAKRYTYCGRTVSCNYYYEYAREEACSTVRLYTASKLDSLSKKDANKHFSDFTSRGWARMRRESQGDCKASPPSDLLRING